MFEMHHNYHPKTREHGFSAGDHLSVDSRGIEMEISSAGYQAEAEQLWIKMPDGSSIELVKGPTGFQKVEATKPQEQGAVQVAFQLSGDAVIITDAVNAVIYLNQQAEKLTGWCLDEALSQPISDVLNIVQKLTSDNIEEIARITNDSQRQTVKFSAGLVEQRFFLIARDQKISVIDCSSTLIREKNGQVVGTIFVLRDASDFTPRLKDIAHSSHLDRLTGLMNRGSFERRLEQAVHDAKFLAQQHILCHIDIDRFKIINEAGGHVAGDEFLRQASQLLRRRIRKTDVLARLGSDEFGLVLYQCSLDQAIKVVQSICEEFQTFRFFWKNQTFNFSISTGIVVLNGNHDALSSALSAAESACQTAKQNGRNRFYIDQPDRHDSTHKVEVHWALRLFNALDENKFQLCCQPIVQLNSYQTNRQEHETHYEILIRLEEETGKLIPAREFIPTAERYGLINLIDRWVIRTLFSVIHQEASQSQNQPTFSNSFYTINLSGASLNDDQFLRFIEEQFQLYSIPPQLICFEITETVAISNLSKAATFMNSLKRFGCQFALDDFGSGMSSFGYLTSLPIDYVKIDGSFIKDIKVSPVACEIVEAISRISRVMGIQTIAEFVEDEDVILKLQSMGINYAQGYGISKPFRLSRLLRKPAKQQSVMN